MDMYVKISGYWFFEILISIVIGAIMGSKDWQTHWRSLERPYKMDNIAIVGAHSYVRRPLKA
jgi:hypothetical protein